MKCYAAYLRKSRADLEAEAHGAGETLARHQHMLEELAEKMQIVISRFYKEVVSGETIASRPVMQQLLADVEANLWSGILVVEVERLARGDTIDQGIVSQTFKYTNTQIITLTKTYNPNNEFDEEFFEFGLFMSRREYKTINRRIQAGRVQSIKEGKFAANKAPFGYERIKLQDEKGFTLTPVPAQAACVQLVFDLYVNQHLGSSAIADKLNKMGYVSRSGSIFTAPAVIGILDNPVYAGYVTWNKRKEVKTMQGGTIKKSRPRAADYIKVKGRHTPLIPEELWNAAQEIRTAKRIASPHRRSELMNPLCGILYCKKCGGRMQRRPAGSRQPADIIMCQNHACTNHSAYMQLIEQRILDTLALWLKEYTITPVSLKHEQNTLQAMQQHIDALKKEQHTLNIQLNHACDFLEQGIYTPEIFMKRTDALNTKLAEITKQLASVETELNTEQRRRETDMHFLPESRTIVDCYQELSAPKAKNDLLKEVIDHIDYCKEVKGHGHEDEFELTIYPVIR